jgi:hypothetical protein
MCGFVMFSVLSLTALQTEQGKVRAKRLLELEAYSALISAFRSQGTPLSPLSRTLAFSFLIDINERKRSKVVELTRTK